MMIVPLATVGNRAPAYRNCNSRTARELAVSARASFRVNGLINIRLAKSIMEKGYGSEAVLLFLVSHCLKFRTKLVWEIVIESSLDTDRKNPTTCS